MLKRLGIASGILLTSVSSYAADISVSLTVPTQNVAEYHQPYVALWLEDSQKKSTQLMLWYDNDMRNNEGQKWLKDLRQWWRRGGRSLKLPADGISGATRKPGTYTLNFNDSSGQLKNLPAGNYKLRLEASREVGGREVLSIPVTWPVSKPQTLSKTGSAELGEFTVTLTP